MWRLLSRLEQGNERELQREVRIESAANREREGHAFSLHVYGAQCARAVAFLGAVGGAATSCDAAPTAG